MIAFFYSLLCKGYKRPLVFEDVYQLLPEDTCDSVMSSIQNELNPPPATNRYIQCVVYDNLNQTLLYQRAWQISTGCKITK